MIRSDLKYKIIMIQMTFLALVFSQVHFLVFGLGSLTGDELFYFDFSRELSGKPFQERFLLARAHSLNFAWPLLLSFLPVDNYYFWHSFVALRVFLLSYSLGYLISVVLGRGYLLFILPYLLAASVYSSLYIRDDLVISFSCLALALIISRGNVILVASLILFLMVLRFYFGVILLCVFFYMYFFSSGWLTLRRSVYLLGVLGMLISFTHYVWGYFFERVLSVSIEPITVVVDFLRMFITPFNVFAITDSVAKYESPVMAALLLPLKIVSLLGVFIVFNRNAAAFKLLCITFLMVIPPLLGGLVGPRQVFILQFSVYVCFLYVVRSQINIRNMNYVR